MTTFQAGSHEAGEPDNQAMQNPINIFKRVSVASENLRSGLLIKHHFLTRAKTVNWKHLAAVSKYYFFLLLRLDKQTAWTDMWSTEWIVQQLCALLTGKRGDRK